MPGAKEAMLSRTGEAVRLKMRSGSSPYLNDGDPHCPEPCAFVNLVSFPKAAQSGAGHAEKTQLYMPSTYRELANCTRSCTPHTLVHCPGRSLLLELMNKTSMHLTMTYRLAQNVADEACKPSGWLHDSAYLAQDDHGGPNIVGTAECNACERYQVFD